jgi:putative transposase
VTFGIDYFVPILTNDAVRRILARTIDEHRHKYAFRLLGYVFMPEHVHLVLVPDEQTKLGPLIGQIKRHSSRAIHGLLKQSSSPTRFRFYIRRNGKMEFALWQRRCFDHNCRTLELVCQKIEYCHYNPVAKGLVQDPADWVWSSYRAYQGETDVPLAIDEFVPIEETQTGRGKKA